MQVQDFNLLSQNYTSLDIIGEPKAFAGRTYQLCELKYELSDWQCTIKAIVAIALVILTCGIAICFRSIQDKWNQAINGEKVVKINIDSSTLPPETDPVVNEQELEDLIIADYVGLDTDEKKQNRLLVFQAVKMMGVALRIVPHFNNDMVIVLAAVRKDGMALFHASKNLQNKRKIVLEAIAKNGYAYSFASKRLQNDPEIIAAAQASKNGRIALSLRT